jgi:hypothetical protein
MPRKGLYMAMTVGVVMKVVNSAMRTNIAKISSLRTCGAINDLINKDFVCYWQKDVC